MKKIIHFIVGARPNFMKIAPIINYWKKSKELKDNFESILVHTGQHYDEAMSGSFLKQLGIDNVDHNLEVGSGSHAVQTGNIMVKYETLCLDNKPDLVVVVGDVNSTIACGLVTKKLNVDLCHIEAGLRSFDRSMPEEINRIATDAITDLFFTTSEEANEQLIKENIPANRIHFVGNLMIDSLLYNINNTYNCPEKGDYALLTLHRPSNVDSLEKFTTILENLKIISQKIKIIFPCHPRTLSNLKKFKLDNFFNNNLVLKEPADYFQMLSLYKKTKFVLTDSGGIQEETTVLGIPCLTLRDNTERPITVTEGTNTLIGSDYVLLNMCVDLILSGNYKKGNIPKYWDGKTAQRIWKVIKDKYC